MARSPDILCIGSVLWDVIGRAPVAMRQGSDVAGRITRLPGGVAMNIAMTLAQFGMTPALLTAIGRDTEGDELVAACAARGMVTDMIYRSDDLPTDRYMAVEGANGLIAAIADAHSLEAAGAKILAPLSDGRLATPAEPHAGPVALDGNLTVDLLSQIAESPRFAMERLQPFLRAGRGTLYVNLEEARLLCNRHFDTTQDAAATLLARGAARALVTDGANPASEGHAGDVIAAEPPKVLVTRVTGAGDTFMAAHIAAEAQGAGRKDALARALEAAADYVSGGSAS